MFLGGNKMETEEAILWLEVQGNYYRLKYSEDVLNKFDAIAELLRGHQQGENDCIELADENQMLKDYIKDLLDEKEAKQDYPESKE